MKKYVCPLSFIWFSYYILLFTPCPTQGQGVKAKKLTPKDYSLWNTLTAKKISDQGTWVSFSMHYPEGEDTLWVKNSSKDQHFMFPGGHHGNFCREKWFACLDANNTLRLLDLHTGKEQRFPNIVSYKFTKDGRFLIYLEKPTKKLFIRSLRQKGKTEIAHVTSYSYHAGAAAVVFALRDSLKNQLGIIHLNNGLSREIIAESSNYPFSTMVWQENGKSLAFFQDPVSGEIFQKAPRLIGYYRLKDKRLYQLNPELVKNFPVDHQVTSTSFANLHISRDNKRVFFGLTKNQQPAQGNDNAKVQIWNARDTRIYPSKIRYQGGDARSKVAVWWPEENAFLQLTNNTKPDMALSADHQYAVIYSRKVHDSYLGAENPVHVNIINLKNNPQKPFVRKASLKTTRFLMSPGGRYIHYFKNRHWWIYDLKNGVHRNLTGKLGVRLDNTTQNLPGRASPYGSPGWIGDDRFLLIYDAYDIWKIAPDGSSYERLTRGRENKVQFWIVSVNKEQKRQTSYDGIRNGLFRESQGIWLKAKGEEGRGYYYWEQNKGQTPLVMGKRKFSQLKIASANHAFMYVEESYDTPPKLVVQRSGENNRVFQSNPQHLLYDWGKAKHIAYQAKGKLLKGILYYPAGYNPNKEYPMIVHIYERQSSGLYEYINPSLFNQTGFNVTNLVTQGYFVLLPDIYYEMGKPGSSAAVCVKAAVEAAVRTASIDSKSIGLIGHSFGGYETDFILTQTNLFAAAVAGAAITDLTRGYFSVGWNYSSPLFFMYEDHQLRMGTPFYGYIEAYLKNSPLLYAENMNTPLLSWSGIEDNNVSYDQTMAFYLALRKLRKEHIMLLYPKEKHVILNKQFQEDLTNRIQQWFDHYLKKEPRPAWFMPDYLDKSGNY